VGLDGDVMCKCLKEGKTSPIPFPDLFYIDEEGFPDVRLENEKRPTEADFDRINILSEWVRHGCEHHRMKYASVRVSNCQDYRSFQRALEQMGWEYFPALHSHLPEANGGIFPAELASKALEEVGYFKQNLHTLNCTGLVNVETQQEIASGVVNESGVLPLAWWNHENATVYMGVDHRGFFIQRSGESHDNFEGNSNRDLLISVDIIRTSSRFLEVGSKQGSFALIPRQDLFRASYFEQRLLADKQVEYINLETGARFTYPAAVIQDKTCTLRVTQRPSTFDDFFYILDPLTTLFEASVSTGNPVRWS
jgi:hypothetical protein